MVWELGMEYFWEIFFVILFDEFILVGFDKYDVYLVVEVFLMEEERSLGVVWKVE